jgi:long-chain-alcohol oxidase
MPRNVQGCTQDASCGFCSYGCQIGAKQSTVKTYLLDAYRRRARDGEGWSCPRRLSTWGK